MLPTNALLPASGHIRKAADLLHTYVHCSVQYHTKPPQWSLLLLSLHSQSRSRFACVKWKNQLTLANQTSYYTVVCVRVCLFHLLKTSFSVFASLVRWFIPVSFDEQRKSFCWMQEDDLIQFNCFVFTVSLFVLRTVRDKTIRNVSVGKSPPGRLVCRVQLKINTSAAERFHSDILCTKEERFLASRPE